MFGRPAPRICPTSNCRGAELFVARVTKTANQNTPSRDKRSWKRPRFVYDNLGFMEALGKFMAGLKDL
ncbi:hypothetical protein L596_008248 [Steinernema carpocapsae]|uniref:Uncharacterized protein n=1 Tax=Steinernema carpocapsae TaxID=34508 RepID=A0A4U5PCZ2_STECR|nr:hypothetical protein L596_008248 [Steinernema carpocapsae]